MNAREISRRVLGDSHSSYHCVLRGIFFPFSRQESAILAQRKHLVQGLDQNFFSPSAVPVIADSAVGFAAIQDG